MTKPYIHPDTPARLKTAYRRAKGEDGKPYNMRALALIRGVNIYWVSKAIRHGERPTNAHTARALFFPKYTRGKNAQSLTASPLPEYEKWWRYTLDKQARNTIKQRLYQHAQEINKGEPI